MQTPVALMLFDIDGTLVRGAGYQHRDALREGVRRITGLDTLFEGIDTAGRLDRDLIYALIEAAGHERAKFLEHVDAICEACCSCYIGGEDHDLSHCVCPGVVNFLEKAQSGGAVLGNVSGNLRAIGRRKLERAGLGKYFAVAGFSEDGHTRAELARVAADEARDSFGLDEWAPVIVIGDHVNDVEAARANGFYSIAVATGVVPLERLQAAEPTLAVPDLTHVDPIDFIASYRGRN